MGEAYVLVRKYEVKLGVLYDMMTDGLFSAPACKGYGKIIAEEASPSPLPFGIFPRRSAQPDAFITLSRHSGSPFPAGGKEEVKKGRAP